MKKVVVLLMLTVFASSAFAVVDDGVNSMGFYFDLNGDVYETTGGPGSIAAYILLVNPDFDALFGYEFGFEVVGNMMIMNVVNNGTGPIDVGGMVGNHIVGLAAPIATTPATLIATVNIFAMDAGEIALTLKGANPSSVGDILIPALLLANDQIVGAGLSAGPGNICAYVNGAGVVATDEVSMDAVKALYR